MPAKSVAQRQAMGIAEAVKKGEMTAKPGSPSAEIAKSMTLGQIHDFSTTKEAGLPQKVKKTPTGNLKKRKI